MTSVRKTSGTTVTLFIFIVTIVVLTRLSNRWDSDFISQMNLILSSRPRIGAFHSIVLGVSFWLLLIASTFDAVFREKKGLDILSAFGIPIIFSGCIAIWGLVVISSYVDLRWFWLFYYVVMLICTKLSFNKISKAKGGGPTKINEFFKTPPSKCDTEVSIVDRYVLFSAKAVLLVLWFLQIIMIIAFCVQYREIFPFT